MAQSGDVAHRLGEFEACVEAPPVGLAEAHPQPVPVERDRHGRGPVGRAAAVRPLAQQPAEQRHLFAVRRVQMLQQLRLVGDERVGGGVPEFLRLDVLGAPQIIDVRLTGLQPQHHPSGPGHSRYGGEPAGDPTAATDAVRYGDRCDVRDLQHGGELVVLGARGGPYGGGIGGKFEEQIALGAYAAVQRHQLVETGCGQPGDEQYRRTGTLYESSCALGC